jgi:hypothetical protein
MLAYNATIRNWHLFFVNMKNKVILSSICIKPYNIELITYQCRAKATPTNLTATFLTPNRNKFKCVTTISRPNVPTLRPINRENKQPRESPNRHL